MDGRLRCPPSTSCLRVRFRPRKQRPKASWRSIEDAIYSLLNACRGPTPDYPRAHASPIFHMRDRAAIRKRLRMRNAERGMRNRRTVWSRGRVPAREARSGRRHRFSPHRACRRAKSGGAAAALQITLPRLHRADSGRHAVTESWSQQGLLSAAKRRRSRKKGPAAGRDAAVQPPFANLVPFCGETGDASQRRCGRGR